jgi:hypothetical protein
MYITFIIGIFIITFSSALFFNNGFLDENKKNLRTVDSINTYSDIDSVNLQKVIGMSTEYMVPNKIKKIKNYISPYLSKSIYIKNLRGKNLHGIIQWYSKNRTCIVIKENIIKNNKKSIINKNIVNKNMGLLLFGFYISIIGYFFILINYSKNNIGVFRKLHQYVSSPVAPHPGQSLMEATKKNQDIPKKNINYV